MQTIGKLSVILFLLSFSFIGCTVENELNERTTLELSESGVISFDATATSKEVNVSSSDPKWECYTTNEWISLAQQGDVLVISAEANKSVKSRIGTVIITAGNTKRQLTVLQNKGELELTAHPTSLSLDQWGGEYTIDILAAAPSWNAKSDDDWIQVQAYPLAGRISVRMAPNKSREQREGKVIIYSDEYASAGFEIPVVQAPIAYFIMPYMDFENATRQDIQLFEEKRGGSLEFNNERFFDFVTTSYAFPRVSYTINEGGAYIHAQLDASSTQLLLGENLRELQTYLKSQGFTKEVAEQTYQHERINNLLVEIKPFYKNTPHLLFTYKPIQKEKYETFDTLPLGFTRFDLGKEGVMDYEAANGGTLSYENDEELEFTTEPGKYGEDGRLYFIHEDKYGNKKLEKTRQFFLDTNRAFWDYKGYNQLTDEFMALCKKEDFEYIEYNILEQVHVFVSKSKNLTMAIQWKKFFGDPKPVIMIQVNPGNKMIAHGNKSK